MKSNTKIFLIFALLTIAFTNGLRNLKTDSNASLGNKSNLKTKESDPADPGAGKSDANSIPTSLRKASYFDLVTNPLRPLCPDHEDPRLGKRNLEDQPMDGYYPAQGPKRKPNPFKIMSSRDTMHINYLFDYLDEFKVKAFENKTLKEIIVKEFTDMFEAAKKITKVEQRFADPYLPKKLLFYFSNGAAGTEPFTDPRLRSPNGPEVKVVTTGDSTKPDEKGKEDPNAPTPREVWETIRAFNKNFDENIYQNSISPMQLLHLLDEWQWSAPNPNRDIIEAKKFLDQYDFNGDGGLNPLEFIIFAIRFNLRQTHQCLKFCFKDIIDKILDPLFMYLDCDNDGFVNSENMWAGLKYINRGGSQKYNIYSCRFPFELNKDYRTNSANDFILKSSVVADGFLNREEFSRGVLMGYWERESTEQGYGSNKEKLDGLVKRWDDPGIKDLECDNIAKFIPKPMEPANNNSSPSQRRRR